jgi:hypothetical protein
MIFRHFNVFLFKSALIPKHVSHKFKKKTVLIPRSIIPQMRAGIQVNGEVTV